MEHKKKRSRHLLFAIVGSVLLLGTGLFSYRTVKTTIVENEQESLLSLAKVSAQNLNSTVWAKENLVYGAFSGDMDGEAEIEKNMLKVGGRGSYIKKEETFNLKEWQQILCEKARKQPGQVITGAIQKNASGNDIMYMTKAVYMKGSITGYVQMEIELNEREETFTISREKGQGCFLEWSYVTVQGVPERICQLVALEPISIGEEQLTLRMVKDYEQVVKPIERISLSFCLIGAILLVWILGFLYKILTQQKEEEKLMRKLEYETELNRVNEALEHQENLMQKYNHSKTIGVLTGAIAHEFNNLMTPIVLYTNLLEEHPQVKADMSEEIVELKHSAERCGELADQMLQYTRLGRAEKVLLDYNATFAVKESARMVERLMPEHIKVKAEICEKSYYVRGQIGALNQIILNLATNALHAMEEKGILTLQFGLSVEDERMVRLIMKDTGQGIPPEIRRRIFEPFFTTKAEKEGTGIGLTVVKRLIEEHGGFIRVESEMEKGTTFVMDIPQVYERKEAEIVEE